MGGNVTHSRYTDVPIQIHERILIMNDKTLNNFKKLSPEKQEELISLIEKMIEYYQLYSDAPHQVEHRD